jgi:divalent metal cation (Fe/Co/Zn/Cd) transporter
LIVVAAVLAGLALLVVAGVYFASTAASLPSFFPGHQAGSTHHHTKHGVAALVVALGCFALAWFQTGPRNRPAA